jgi:hypothetical protein
LTEIRPRVNCDPLANERKLVQVEGQPVSEIIIEERR